MRSISVHFLPDSGRSKVVLHHNLEHPLRPETVVVLGRPAGLAGTRGVPERRFRPDDIFYWQKDLYLASRKDRTLVVEPESANWAILDERQERLFLRMQNLIEFHEILENDLLSPKDTEGFLSFLLEKNILRQMGQPVIFSPVMPEVQEFPTFLSLHVTEDCNFRCRYCYTDSVSSGKKMSEKTGFLIAEKIFRDFADFPVSLEFHGGEPLLALDVIEAILAGTERFSKKYGKTVRKYMIQTNGSLIRREMIDLFRRFDIAVGTSLDGPPEIHNRNRLFPNGRGTFQKVIQGLKILREAGIQGGVIAVIQDPQEYVPVCEFILSLGITGFRINHMVCQGRGEAMLDLAPQRGKQFALGFLRMVDYLYDYAEEHPDRHLDVWPVNVMLLHLLSPARPFMCMRSPCGAGSQGLGFAFNGDIYPCEQLVGIEELKVGNIHERRALDEILKSSPVIAKIRERTVEAIPACRGCPWRNFCGGGCTAEAFAVHRTLAREDILCSFYGKVFEELAFRLREKPGMLRLLGQFERCLA